jgi:hypothetical protein
MSKKVVWLSDADLESVTGGDTKSPPVTTVSRVKTSDKMQHAVLAFIKG